MLENIQRKAIKAVYIVYRKGEHKSNGRVLFSDITDRFFAHIYSILLSLHPGSGHDVNSWVTFGKGCQLKKVKGWAYDGVAAAAPLLFYFDGNCLSGNLQTSFRLINLPSSL